MGQQQFVEVSFREAGELFLFDSNNLNISTNDPVIVQTEHGPALGTVKRIEEVESEAPTSFKIYKVLRVATQDDLRRAARHEQKEREAFEYCRQKVEEYRLPMKLIRAENFFNGSKLLFYFSAEGRVDFRTLVRDLARYFQKRIEMRQIGVRDSAKLIGGVGACGQELCCSRFLRQFHPVSIRMVKDQNLPLNQQKVSGVCGRLMCCLAYEQGLYKEMRKRLPKVGQDVETPKGIGKVREVQPLQETIRVVFLHERPPSEEEFHLKDLPEFRDKPEPEPVPVEFDQQKRNNRKRRRGLEPLMEPRRGGPPPAEHKREGGKKQTRGKMSPPPRKAKRGKNKEAIHQPPHPEKLSPPEKQTPEVEAREVAVEAPLPSQASPPVEEAPKQTKAVAEPQVAAVEATKSDSGSTTASPEKEVTSEPSAQESTPPPQRRKRSRRRNRRRSNKDKTSQETSNSPSKEAQTPQASKEAQAPQASKEAQTPQAPKEAQATSKEKTPSQQQAPLSGESKNNTEQAATHKRKRRRRRRKRNKSSQSE